MINTFFNKQILEAVVLGSPQAVHSTKLVEKKAPPSPGFPSPIPLYLPQPTNKHPSFAHRIVYCKFDLPLLPPRG